MTEEAKDLIIARPGDGILLLTLNRPKVRNALNTNLVRLIGEAVRDAATDESVRCVVVTGGPDVFAAGADINELRIRPLHGPGNDERFQHWESVQRFPKPIVAAVNGYALGGGCELAMLADIAIAGDTAKFGLPELRLGIIPGLGGTQRLVRVAGKAMAMKMILSSEFIDAPSAHACGLVAEVVPAATTIGRALELARKIADQPPLAIRMAKQSVLAAYETTLSQGLHFERNTSLSLYPTEDKAEGIAAFLEKRKPSFKGR
ncbi:MAG: 2,3-dehydroadipyl-CoA hydratase [Alphaproteobacteria bacterium]|nr:2,3-dehydroadipyl-CoA hydratase [Alphaproteobacteria bacterium]